MVVVLLALIFATFPRRGVAPERSGSNALPSFPMSVVSIHDTSSKMFDISIEYPQFPSLASQFNQDITDAVMTRLASFKKDGEGAWTARQATRPSGTMAQEFPDRPFDFIATWEPAQTNERYVSFIIHFYYFAGGAHGAEELQTFNYDCAKKTDVRLSDLFSGTPDYLQKISQTARQQLLATLETASAGHVQTDMLDQGTAPTVDNFKNFTFAGTTVTIYFPKYQVAPGVFGEQQVTVARDGR